MTARRDLLHGWPMGWSARLRPLRPALAPVALLYGTLVAARAWAYRRGVIATRRAVVPVISVGNLTVGGSGKSPVVEFLVREAAWAGLPAAVLTRGHGRRGRSDLLRVRMVEGMPASPRAMGDEPYWLAQRNPELAVIVGRDRAAAARLAAVVDAPRLLLLDDGFQHLRLARDLNVLLVDAERGLGNGRLLPWGVLREPPAALARADVILITKAGLGDADAVERLLRERHGARAPIFRCDYRPARLRRLDGGAEAPLEALHGATARLVCAIAQPEGFAQVVAGLGARVAERLFFSDHHPYPPATLARLDAWLAEAPPEHPTWLTTEKDAVKLAGRLDRPQRLWVVEMNTEPEPAARAFFFDFLSALKLESKA